VRRNILITRLISSRKHDLRVRRQLLVRRLLDLVMSTQVRLMSSAKKRKQYGEGSECGELCGP
jgi:hypothetical protein